MAKGLAAVADTGKRPESDWAFEFEEPTYLTIGLCYEENAPYLKAFVIARLNPLRFQKAAKPGQKAPRGAWDATMKKMLESAEKFDVGKVKASDLAASAGGAGRRQKRGSR